MHSLAPVLFYGLLVSQRPIFQHAQHLYLSWLRLLLAVCIIISGPFLLFLSWATAKLAAKHFWKAEITLRCLSVWKNCSCRHIHVKVCCQTQTALLWTASLSVAQGNWPLIKTKSFSPKRTLTKVFLHRWTLIQSLFHQYNLVSHTVPERSTVAPHVLRVATVACFETVWFFLIKYHRTLESLESGLLL